MAKKGTKIALTYFITIFISILIIAAAGMIFMKKMLAPSQSAADIEVTSSSDEGYEPTMLDNQTTLFILDAGGDKLSSTVFVLTRLLPSEKSLLIVPLQSDTYANVNGTENTLFGFYEDGGCASLKRAIETDLDTAIDRYMKFDYTNFEKFAAQFAAVNYDIPYALIYEDPATGETTVIRQGGQIMDPTTMLKVFTFPEFKPGETARNAAVGSIVTDFINASVSTRLRTGADAIAQSAIENNTETDISIYDYEFKKEAIQYILDNTDRPAELIIPSGNYDETGKYVLEDAFVTSLKSRFNSGMYTDTNG